MPETRGNAEKTKWWYVCDSISKVAQNRYLVKVSEIEFPWHFAGVLHRPTLSTSLKQPVPPSYGSPYALRCPQIALYALLQFSPRCFSPNSKKGCKRILHVLRRYTLSRRITGVSKTIQGAELPVQFPAKKEEVRRKKSVQVAVDREMHLAVRMQCSIAGEKVSYIRRNSASSPDHMHSPFQSCTKFWKLHKIFRTFLYNL